MGSNCLNIAFSLREIAKKGATLKQTTRYPQSFEEATGRLLSVLVLASPGSTSSSGESFASDTLMTGQLDQFYLGSHPIGTPVLSHISVVICQEGRKFLVRIDHWWPRWF